jgi:predicted esterase
MNTQRALIQTQAIADYIYRPNEEGPVFLLLHGFNERAKRIARITQDIIPKRMATLAPNAPFPLPQKVRSEQGDFYKIGFAWYFFDDIKEEFYIDYDLPVAWLKSLLEALDLLEREIIVIGYSQGGYLAPFIAQALPNCIGAIGIHCRFRDDMLSLTPPRYPLYTLHAELDDKVDTSRSRQSAQTLIDRGYRLSSTVISDETHEIGPKTLQELDKIIQSLTAHL